MWIKNFSNFSNEEVEIPDKLKLSDFSVYEIGQRYMDPISFNRFEIVGKSKKNYTLNWKIGKTNYFKRTETIPHEDINLYDDYIRMGLPHVKL